MRTRPTAFLVAVLVLGGFTVADAAAACIAQSGPRTVPLVELYTSEGCSSCPPADRWFSQHVAGDDANWLAFHVDYWDDTGWRDRFSDAAYSRRQRMRVAAAGESVVYTPQFMIGSSVQAPWRASIAPMLGKASGPSLASLAMRYAPGVEGGELALGAARAARAGAAQVWLAQYSDAETTRVAAGENAGVTLHHDRVVRKLWGPWPLASKPVSRRLALRAPSQRWGVTAFVQDAQGRVWQSLNLPIAGCAAR
jgi:hypothetical protein